MKAFHIKHHWFKLRLDRHKGMFSFGIDTHRSKYGFLICILLANIELSISWDWADEPHGN